MTNWCSNMVWFRGAPEPMKQVRAMFTQMAKRGRNSNDGQLPELITDKRGYFFGLICGGDVFEYRTKLTPNTDILILIAKYYGVNFTSSFDEPGNGIYGEANYSQGVLTLVALENADFGLYHYDDQSKGYFFEGKNYADESLIKDILLQRKKHQMG